jgi:hypothetical protein
MVSTQGRSLVCRECHNRDTPARQVLLIPEIEIRRQQHIEVLSFRDCQKVAVGELAPTKLVGKRNSMTGQES